MCERLAPCSRLRGGALGRDDIAAATQLKSLQSSAPSTSEATPKMPPKGDGMSFEQRAARVKPEIEALISQADSAAGEQQGERQISVLEEVIALLLAWNLAWHEKVPAQWIGVHPDNRWGSGVEAVQV